ncbi:hypothetical protein AAEX28_01030 [Lentisphaerota bacterium WC36G]|nr:hypothetical protein LJT99_03910 [Lentisphaerae bacterium WC36]
MNIIKKFIKNLFILMFMFFFINVSSSHAVLCDSVIKGFSNSNCSSEIIHQHLRRISHQHDDDDHEHDKNSCLSKITDEYFLHNFKSSLSKNIFKDNKISTNILAIFSFLKANYKIVYENNNLRLYTNFSDFAKIALKENLSSFILII